MRSSVERMARTEGFPLTGREISLTAPLSEEQMRALIQEYQHLKKMNTQLTQTKHHLSREKEQLLMKQKGVVQQVESMLARLKSIEGLL